jgi:hypothetical protein
VVIRGFLDTYRAAATLSVNSKWLLQLRVVRFCNDEDGNVGIGVFPQRKEILIRRLGFGCVALQHIGAGAAFGLVVVRVAGSYFGDLKMAGALPVIVSAICAVMRGGSRFARNDFSGAPKFPVSRRIVEVERLPGPVIKIFSDCLSVARCVS